MGVLAGMVTLYTIDDAGYEFWFGKGFGNIVIGPRRNIGVEWFLASRRPLKNKIGSPPPATVAADDLAQLKCRLCGAFRYPAGGHRVAGSTGTARAASGLLNGVTLNAPGGQLPGQGIEDQGVIIHRQRSNRGRATPPQGLLYARQNGIKKKRRGAGKNSCSDGQFAALLQSCRCWW